MTPKRLHVPIRMLEAVCKLTLNKSKKPKASPIYTNPKPVVMYKMISTEDWKKKEAEKKAHDDRIKANNEKPKKESSILAALGGPAGKRLTKAEKQKRQKEYYFKRKEYFKQYNAKRYLKLSKPKINPFDAIP